MSILADGAERLSEDVRRHRCRLLGSWGCGGGGPPAREAGLHDHWPLPLQPLHSTHYSSLQSRGMEITHCFQQVHPET